MPRDITQALYFRTDLSPFLVHLTRTTNGKEAGENLRSIIETKELRAGPTEVSDAKYGGNNVGFPAEDRSRFFCAVCLSETPIGEVHCLLDIDARQTNLSSYGLAFLKKNIASQGASPVIYLNNRNGDQDPVNQALFKIIESDPNAAERVLPLVSVFGKKLKPPGWGEPLPGEVDWLWEREWRIPAVKAPLCFEQSDVFIGFCPDSEIDEFEELLPGVGFVDPLRNMRWYAPKLIAARQRLNLPYSVV